MYSKQYVCFLPKETGSVEPGVFVSGERLKVVPEYKYLRVLFYSNLSFKSLVKKVCNRVKFNLISGSHALTEATKTFMHSMVISHIT